MTHCSVDVNHDGNNETRQSQTSTLLFCNSVPIIWFRNRQNSVEASTFASEFTSIRNTLEIIEAFNYKMRMFGVPIDR